LDGEVFRLLLQVKTGVAKKDFKGSACGKKVVVQ